MTTSRPAAAPRRDGPGARRADTGRGESEEPIRFGARAGLVAYGVMHLLVAWLAVQLAFGRTERADQTGAMQTLAAQPFGRATLWLVAASFAVVVLWRLREAARGYRHVGDTPRRLRLRLYSAGQALLFGVLAGLAVRVAAGLPAGGGGQGMVARLLALPAGPGIVVALGVGVLLVGAAMAYRGWRLGFADHLDLSGASPATRAIVHRTGQVGSVAKAVAVGVVGGLVTSAGLTYQPARAEGLDAAMKSLLGHPFGAVPLLLVALGLASYGVFSFFDARYHRV